MAMLSECRQAGPVAAPDRGAWLHERGWDLLREMRHQLLAAKLITPAECVELSGIFGTAGRIEDYSRAHGALEGQIAMLLFSYVKLAGAHRWR